MTEELATIETPEDIESPEPTKKFEAVKATFRKFRTPLIAIGAGAAGVVLGLKLMEDRATDNLGDSSNETFDSDSTE